MSHEPEPKEEGFTILILSYVNKIIESYCSFHFELCHLVTERLLFEETTENMSDFAASTFPIQDLIIQ